MGLANWNLDQLKTLLSQRGEVKAWIITEEYIHRRERYLMNDHGKLETDQDRTIHSRNLSIRLFVHLPKTPEGTPAERQGEITKKLFVSLPLTPQIDGAIEAALQTDHQAWDLPQKISAQIPQYRTTDPKIEEDIDRVMNEVTLTIKNSVSKKRPSDFNSAELFISVHNRELHLSNGLTHRSSQSRIYTEAAFSFAQSPTRSDEYMTTQWAVHLKFLPISNLFDEAASRAEHSLDVEKPKTGKYSVIIDSEVLAQLLGSHLSLLSASNSYHGLPFIPPGKEFIPNTTGELLSITIDPTLDFGASTTAISAQGLIQTPLKLVEKNQVIATTTSKQYGDYLGAAPTTVQGNLVVEPGNMNYEDLTHQSPSVIEILQFSGLFIDPNTGTFSSEIRLAKLHDNLNGKVTYLKGGSLSGSISENFRGLKLSKTQVNRAHFSSESPHGQGYYGPDFALLSDVSIVG